MASYLLGGNAEKLWLGSLSGGGEGEMLETDIWPRCATNTSGQLSDSGTTTTGVSKMMSRLNVTHFTLC